jgi:hypothetical protein
MDVLNKSFKVSGFLSKIRHHLFIACMHPNANVTNVPPSLQDHSRSVISVARLATMHHPANCAIKWVFCAAKCFGEHEQEDFVASIVRSTMITGRRHRATA